MIILLPKNFQQIKIGLINRLESWLNFANSQLCSLWCHIVQRLVSDWDLGTHNVSDHDPSTLLGDLTDDVRAVRY